MKKYFKYRILLALTAIMAFTACDDEFLNRPPEDGYSLDAFYSSNEQVTASTNALYSRVWFNFHNKAFYAIAEVGSGNAFTYSSDVNSMRDFSITSSDPELANAWKSLWAVIAQSNALINYLPERVGPGVSADVLANAIGEAHMMRGLAYFYLARLWGPVPIITNNLDHVESPQLNTNPVTDIYEFIERDLEFAVASLPEKIRGTNYDANGHASAGTAKALLAKVHLYQGEYTDARMLAEQVINSGEFKLYGGPELPGKSYADLFLTTNNNNEESILALQWKATASYGTANNNNTQFAYSSYINEASYGGVFAPSQDIMGTFEPGDKRRKETYMLPGDVYPNIRSADGVGFTVPANIDAQNSNSGIKKYVVGKISETAGPADQWGMMENNTYLMRYAELLLIHAEAVMNGGGSTSDAAALTSFNAVRIRAGLGSLPSITFNDILHERRVELAFEGDYWYDLGRIPRAQAIAIMSAQNRGDADNVVHFTPTESDFRMPYPDGDAIKNPKLNQPPVPYNFD